MEKKLARKKDSYKTWYYANNEKKYGIHDGIRGDVSGISGDLNACGLSQNDRKEGVDIDMLVEDYEKEYPETKTINKELSKNEN